MDKDSFFEDVTDLDRDLQATILKSKVRHMRGKNDRQEIINPSEGTEEFEMSGPPVDEYEGYTDKHN